MLVVVGAKGRAHQPEEAAQDAVLVEVRHRVEVAADLFDEGPPAFLPVALEGGVEADMEEMHERPRDRGVAGERRFHVLLAEGRPGLAQELAVRAQDRDLAPAEPRPQDEAVEPVVLRVPLPYALEGLLELLPDSIDVDFQGLAGPHAEIVHPHARAVRALDSGRLPGLDNQPHVLEHGEGIGKRDRLLRAEELEMEHVGSRLERTVEAHRDGVAGTAQALHAVDVVDRHPGVVARLVVGGECLSVAPEACHALLFPAVVEQLVVKVVAPVPGVGAEARLQLGDIHRHRPGRRHPEHEVEAREHGFRELHREVDVDRPERVREQVLDLEPHLRVEALPGHVHDARDEAPDAVAVHEEADSLALLQVEDAHPGLEELVVAHLEEQVSREGLQDVQERLGGVAVGRVGGALHDPGDLLAQEWNRPRHLVVGGRGVEPEEAPLSGDTALFVELLDADVVEVAGAMHGGAGVRLGDHEQTGFAGEAPNPGAQAGEGVGIPGLGLPKNSEAGSFPGAQPFLAFLAQQLVLAVAEESEVVVPDPRQKVAPTGDLGLIERRGAGLDLLEHRAQPLLHRRPVLDRGAHVREHAVYARGNVVEHLLLGLAVDFDMDHRLHERFAPIRGAQDAVRVSVHLHHRMDHEMRGERAPIELHAHRIDEERHVVRDHLHDAVGRSPAVLRLHGVVHPHPGLPRLALVREVEVRERRTVEVDDAAVFEILRRGAGVIGPHEALRRLSLPARHALAQEFEDGFDNRIHAGEDRVR